MTAERRLSAIEAALTPTELVVRWLDEAHAHGGIEAHARAGLEDPAYEPPINRLAREARDGVLTSMRGKPREEIAQAADTAVRETLFRFHLALRINTVTYGLLDRQVLIQGAFSAMLALLANEPAMGQGSVHISSLPQLRDAIVDRVSELRAAGAARRQVEGRYLGGHSAVFPDARTDWDRQLETAIALAGSALRLAELDGLPALPLPAAEVVAARVDALVADLVEPAKVIALEQLGEGGRSLGIATSWLRGKLAPAS